ncbi:MAG TPA: hypothetical protein VN976_07115 [Verrucomicrobiae bacterium]|nr:hypothetical protein [Verrucomicrobiae bacterium]
MKEKIQVGDEKEIDFYPVKAIPLVFSLIRVHPRESVVPNPMHQKNRGERSTPGCGAGMETLGRVA